MAITREQVLEAVEKYLPKTVNFAQSEDLGSRDQDAIFDRIQQIFLTAVLVDKESVFYVIYLAAQRLLADINTVISLLEALEGVDQLRGISGEDPSRIESYSKLEAASVSLVRLSSGIVTDGIFGETNLSEFSSDIRGFLSDEITSNVQGGNRDRISSDIRATMESLQTSWASVLTRRDLLFSLLDKYVDQDLRTKVASIVISAIQEKIQELLEELPALSTSAQAEQAEQVLVDLAAADASLGVVGSASSPIGTILATGFSGSTGASYLVLEGQGLLVPIRSIRAGDDGKNKFYGPAVGGSTFTSLTGQTVFDSGTLTPFFSDPGIASFVAEGIESGMYLTLVDAGTTHLITEVTPTQLTLSPATLHIAATAQRYAITTHVPGAYLNSASGNFWTALGTATVASTELASGTAGTLPIFVKISGSDGTNLIAEGSDGVFVPRKAEGSASTEATGGLAANQLQDPSATFLTDGVAPGDEIYIATGANVGFHTVVSVDSQTVLTTLSTFISDAGPNSWYVRDPNAVDWFEDANASFLTDGIDAGTDTIYVAAVANGPPGDRVISSVESQTLLELGGGPFVYETSVSWEVRATSNTKFYSNSVNFSGAGVTAGDFIEIVGEGAPIEITAVDQNELTLASSLSSTSISSVSFFVYIQDDPAKFYATTFTQADLVDFEVEEISSTVEVTEYVGGNPTVATYPALLDIDGVTYSVRGRAPESPTDTLLLNPLTRGRGDFTSLTVFEDSSQDFVAAGVDASKHILVIVAGDNEGEEFLLSSVSETSLEVTGTPPSISADNTYEIWPLVITSGTAWEVNYGSLAKRLSVTSGPDPFTSDSVGWEIVWDPEGPNERRTKVDTAGIFGTVWLTDPLPEGETANYAYMDEVFGGQLLVAAGRSYAVVQVVNDEVIEVDPPMSNALGKNVDYRILPTSAQSPVVNRIYDPVSAAAYNPTLGFTDDLVGLSVDLNVGRSVRTTVARPYDGDGDGFAESLQINTPLKIGRRQIAWRILSGDEGSTNQFFSPNAEYTTAPSGGEYLTLWTIPDLFEVSAASVGPTNSTLTVTPSLDARLSAQTYAVTEGGADNYGRYVLFDLVNSEISVDPTTDTLRLNVAEVLLDFGTVLIPRESGTLGEVPDDGDDDGESYIFTDSAATFLSTAKYGDRLRVDYGGSIGVRVTFVTRVLSDTTLWVSPEVPEGSALSWSLDRNSVSASLVESSRLRAQMSTLLEAVTNYTVDTNETVEGVISLLEEQRLDRAVDLLYDGKIDEFINLDRPSSSYSSRAKAAVQSSGLSTTATKQTQANLAGTSPTSRSDGTSNTTFTTAGAAAGAGTASELTEAELEVGLSESSTAAVEYTVGPTNNAATGYGSGIQSQDIDVKVALAKAVNDLEDDELLRSLYFATFEESRNRAIYELTGEVESGVITDTDPTLPWINQTGSIRARVESRYEEAAAALQYMIDNPDKFDDTSEGE